MAIFKTAAARYLEPASVMIAAPMLAVAVGLASRYKSIAMICGIAALCLGALYGGQLAQPEQSEGLKTAEQQVHTDAKISSSHLDEDRSQPRRTFFDRIDMDLLPERIAWIAIGFVSLMLVAERAIRHIRLAEPLELEWTK